MVGSRGWRTSLVAVTLAVACGDSGGPGDFVPEGGPVDAGSSDAAIEAGPSKPSDPPKMDAAKPIDAGVDASDTPPPDDDDAGAPPTCDDLDCSNLDDACNVGACDAVWVTCVKVPVANGTSCGDETDTLCTNPDTCEAGACVPNDAPSGEPCGVPGVVCHFDDTCDGSGQCQDGGLWSVGTFCGDMTDTECDNPDSCNASGQCVPGYEPVDAPCGDQDVACRYDDGCNGSGSCTDKGAWVVGACPRGENGTNCYCGEPDEPPLTFCHPARDVCDGVTCVSGDLEDGTLCGALGDTDEQCDRLDTCLAGQCADNVLAVNDPCDDPPSDCMTAPVCDLDGNCGGSQPVPMGTPCGGPTIDECDDADTCDAGGTCLDNFVDAGTPCGDDLAGDCNDPDTCDGAGACDANQLGNGAPCGDQNEPCLYDDECNDGICVDNGIVPACFITVSGIVGELGSSAPLAGVTVTVLGSSPLESDVTDVDGSFTLDVVPAADLILHYGATAMHWGLYKAYRYLPEAPDIGTVLLNKDTDAVNGTSMVPDLPPLDFSKGVVSVEFTNFSEGGGESASLSAASAPSFTLNADGMGILSGSRLPGGQSKLFFINVTTGSTTVNIAGAPGVNDCSPAHPGIVNWPVAAHTLTEVFATCVDL